MAFSNITLFLGHALSEITFCLRICLILYKISETNTVLLAKNTNLKIFFENELLVPL